MKPAKVLLFLALKSFTSGDDTDGLNAREDMETFTLILEVSLLHLAIFLHCDELVEDMLEAARETIQKASANLSANEKNIINFTEVRNYIFKYFLDARVKFVNDIGILFSTLRKTEQNLEGMNMFHLAIQFNPGIVPKLVEYVEDKLSLTYSQKYTLLNSGNTRYQKTPAHFAAKYGSKNCLRFGFEIFVAATILTIALPVIS